MEKSEFFQTAALFEACNYILEEAGVKDEAEKKRLIDCFAKKYGETLGKIKIAEIELEVEKLQKKV